MQNLLSTILLGEVRAGVETMRQPAGQISAA
jgi:hypothetical protein